MSALLAAASTAGVDLALRPLDSNGLPHRLLAETLALPFEDVDAAASGSMAALRMADRERLALFCAILIRLEIRFGHEPRAVRQALSTPVDALDGHALKQVMTRGIDGLRAVHRVVGEMVLPAEQWWRIAPRR